MTGRKGGTEGGSAPVFRLADVEFSYPGARKAALAGVDLAVPPGEVVGILGPNGSGKSTLLKVLLGVLRPRRGEVAFQGRSLETYSRREVARKVGVVSQREDLPFPVAVREYVGMGRYPHLGLWRSEGPEDREAIHRAMHRCGVEDLARRGVDTLSGGELQRVRLARALAQEPEALVLDEPTAALDVRYEMEIFELVSGLAREDAVTVVLVTHHLNLAARYASSLLLLHEGRAVRRGSPGEVLEARLLAEVYGWPVTVVPHPGPGPDRGAPQVIPLAAQPSPDREH